MPIILALMLVMIWAQVISSIYALINPFIEEMWDIQQYNVAYYWAVASVERAELTLKKHTAWFEGSWWWLGNNNFWPTTDFSNIDKKYFWFLAFTGNGYGMYWDIKNLNKDWMVPEPWKWDLDPDVSSWNNYYKLTFDQAIQIALYKDDQSWIDGYYTWYTVLTNIKPANSLDVSIRVPQKLYNSTGYDNKVWWDALDAGSNKIDLDWDEITNDIIVNWSLFWLTWSTQFTVFPSINLSWTNIVADNDTSIREDVINWYNSTEYNVKFVTTPGNKDTNPIEVWTHKQNIKEFNESPEWVIWTWFNMVLWTDGSTTKMHAKFSLVNLLKYDNDKVYPYLEIKITNDIGAIPKPLPDTYFHILWEWKVGKYDVRIKIAKPIFETTAASDFTVLF